jgi:hypothetical protein
MNTCSALKTIVPDQVCAFVGTGAYVEIPPDCTLFEGEPVTYTNLLSVLNQSDAEGGGSIPPGYTQLEYLDSSGTQYFALPMRWETHTGLSVKGGFISYDSMFFGGELYPENIRCGSYPWSTTSNVVFKNTASSLYAKFDYGTIIYGTLNFLNDGLITINDATTAYRPSARDANIAMFGIMDYLKGYGDGSYKPVNTDPCRLYFLKISNDSIIERDFVPVLDSDGTPCLYDKISRKCFYNSGTGSFIVGMTMRQLPALLHLPRVTSGELKLSLPWEAQLVKYGAPAILEEVKNRGWTLIVQYAEPDVNSAVYNKYATCKTCQDMLAVNPNYKNDLTIEKEWVYPTPSFERTGLAFLDTKNGFFDTRAESVDFYAPIATDLYCLFFSSPNLRKAHIYAPNATDITFCFRHCRLLIEATGDISSVQKAHSLCYYCRYLREWTLPTPKLTNGTEMFYFADKLEDVQTEFPALSNGKNMFHLCILNKESVIRVANSLPTWTSGTHEMCFGIHVDHQNDEEVLAALEAVEARGWTLTVQWNGTATEAAAATYGLRKPPIYAKIGTIEYPDGTTEQMLEWGHYVTNWEENGYTEFASLEEAYAHFNLTMPE